MTTEIFKAQDIAKIETRALELLELPSFCHASNIYSQSLREEFEDLAGFARLVIPFTAIPEISYAYAAGYEGAGEYDAAGFTRPSLKELEEEDEQDFLSGIEYLWDYITSEAYASLEALSAQKFNYEILHRLMMAYGIDDCDFMTDTALAFYAAEKERTH
jgi:hypothetical protein